jgi:glutamine amidotransferase
MKIALIKYNAGNIQSVKFALNRIGIEPIVTDNISEIQSADKVIFPGVGEASGAMNFLKQNNLDTVIKELTQPVLGICLGMQLLCKHSEEGNTDCLGIFETSVKKFSFENKPELKVPQIGWNTVTGLKTELFNKINEKQYMYFVHGYYANLCDGTIAVTEYGFKYSSALNKNNFYGVQFHPEKSADAGQTLLENFIKL